MDKQTFKNRTKQMAVRIIKMTNSLPSNKASDIIGRQIIRSNYPFKLSVQQRLLVPTIGLHVVQNLQMILLTSSKS